METTRRQLLLASLGTAVLTSPVTACATFGGPAHGILGRHGSSPEDFMRIAIELARWDLVHFGAVLVDRTRKKVVGVGQNRSVENPTRHAEIVAIDDYFAQLGWFDHLDKAIFGLRDTALYTTAESCPMCMGAIVWAKIPEVYYGSSIPFLVAQGQEQIDVRAETIANAANFERPKVISGILEAECNALYQKTA
jgi:tRNA(Arg) A34 adenosine deaminase TadA